MLQVNRAYSTAFSAHRELILRLARRGWGRLQEAGVVMDFEDVFQEMSVIYVKAAEGYDPTRGITFTAYLGRAIWNDFNKFAEKLINDQCGLGLVRVSDIGTEDEMDFYEIVPSSAQTPEEHYINARSFRDNMDRLPVTERQIIQGFMLEMARPQGGEEKMSLGAIMRSMNLSRSQSVAARKRIGDVFGVDLKGIK